MEMDVAKRGRSSGFSRDAIFKLRGLIPVPALVIMFAWSNPTGASFALGGAIALAGEIIRLWAAGYIRKYRVSEVQADELVSAGPYAFVRNPLYWGNFLIGLGFAVIANWWPAYFLFGALYLYIYSSVVPHEEAFLREKFGRAYDAYCAEVPRVFPRLTPYSKANGTFRAAVAWNGEAITIAILCVVALFFALKLWF